MVFAIAADGLSSFASGIARFVLGEFVSVPFRMDGASTFARDLSLLFSTHRRESSPCTRLRVCPS